MKVDFRRMTSSSSSLKTSSAILSSALLCLMSCLMTSYVVGDATSAADVDDVTYIQDVAVPCCGAHVTSSLTVVVVCSAAENRERRDVIRRTWGSHATPDLRVVFLLGRSGNTDADDVDGSVADESRRHGDVIQGDFVDTYANLTLKSLVALRWVQTHCPCVRFLLKSDDDVFLNTPLLVSDLSTCAHRRFVMGHVIARARPVRDPEEKLYTPESVFPGAAYPTYASGAAYVISGDAVRLLLDAARTVRRFWIEDVYVTGMLGRTAGVQLIVNGKFDGYRTLSDVCAVRNHLVLHRVSAGDMERLWQAVGESGHSRCPDDPRIRL